MRPAARHVKTEAQFSYGPRSSDREHLGDAFCERNAANRHAGLYMRASGAAVSDFIARDRYRAFLLGQDGEP